MSLDIAPPPARWDFSYVGPGIELRLSRLRVSAVCRLFGVIASPGRRLWGCAMWAAGGCLIVIPKVDEVVSVEDQEKVRRHEQAHCNGMGEDHR